MRAGAHLCLESSPATPELLPRPPYDAEGGFSTFNDAFNALLREVIPSAPRVQGRLYVLCVQKSEGPWGASDRNKKSTPPPARSVKRGGYRNDAHFHESAPNGEQTVATLECDDDFASVSFAPDCGRIPLSRNPANLICPVWSRSGALTHARVAACLSCRASYTYHPKGDLNPSMMVSGRAVATALCALGTTSAFTGPLAGSFRAVSRRFCG